MPDGRGGDRHAVQRSRALAATAAASGTCALNAGLLLDPALRRHLQAQVKMGRRGMEARQVGRKKKRFGTQQQGLHRQTVGRLREMV